MSKFNNIPGQDAPKSNTKNKFEAEDIKPKGTKVVAYKAKPAEEKKSYPGVWGKGSGSSSKSDTTPAVTKTTAPAATKTASKPVAKSSPISSSYGSDEDVARQSSIDENAKFFKDRGAFKSGGMVKSSASRGDGIAQRGKTKGRLC
jgi:hypothetical protein